MVAGETQKSYGALDTYAEQNGRQQAKRLRKYCAELGQLASKLEHASLLPEGDAERTTWQAEAAAVRSHAAALKQTVENVEIFIKRGIARAGLHAAAGDGSVPS